MTQGIVLLAHGSRDERWREPIEAVAERVCKNEPNARVACAYMELATPDLPMATAALIASGATAIRVVPLFLGMGKHAREDLPRLLAAARARHPDVCVEASAAVGERTEVLDLLATLALQQS